MKNNEALKKHHFWILFGLIPLFVLIAVFTISSSVGGKIAERTKAIEDANKDLAGKTGVKTKGDISLWDKVIEQIDGKRGGLWKQNWVKQKDLFVWPRSRQFANFERVVTVDGKETRVPVRLEDLAFGEKIEESGDQFQFEEFRKPEFYRALFSTAGLKDRVPPGAVGMADTVAPTQFNGGWERVLRHVNDFGAKKLVSDQLWLMMEDVWVQRSMLEAVKSVNDQMSSFARVKYEDAGGKVIDDPDSKAGPNDPLRRKFRSRIWEVSVEVASRGNTQYLKGSLENITERLQVLGIGKTLRLKVWLDGKRDQDGNIVVGPDGQPDVEGIEPVEFKIGSEFLPGKGGPKKKAKDRDGKEVEVPANVVSVQPDETNDREFDKYLNIIPAGTTVSEIVKVEQEFDTQTVPIRRIEGMALGFPDNRYAEIKLLKTPDKERFKVLTAAPAAAAGDPTMGGGLPGPGAGVGTPDGGRLPGPGGDPRGSGDGMTPGGVAGSGGGPVTTVIDANKNRYVEVTPQVRRMPVGIVVIVDQSYIQDVLLAFANSPLRFQVTQVRWSRFRGSLGGSLSNDPYSGPGGGVMVLQPGDLGSGLQPGDVAQGVGPGPRGRFPMQPGPGPGPGPGPAPGPGTGSPDGVGPGFGQPPFGSGGPEGGFPGYGDFGSLTSVSEAQLTAGLVELHVYGVVSLYEKYDPAKDTSAPKEGGTGTTDSPEPKPEQPKDKDGQDPMPGTPANPKMRVRRRGA